MGLALQLRKMRMFRKWMAHQQAYEDRDEEAERWTEFLQEWESDKALNRLAESFSAEGMYDYYNGMECPVCSNYCPIEGDEADCNNCEVRWSVINEGTFTYLDAESFSDWADDEKRTHGKDVSFEKWSQEEFEDEPAHRHANGQLSFVRWAKDEMNEKHHNAEGYDAETYVHIVKDKKRDEITALVSVFKEPNLGGQALHHRHEWEDNKEKIISWATNNGYPIQYWEEENYMAQPQKVDTFDAESFEAQTSYPFWSVVKVMSDGIDYDWGVEDHDSLEEAKESCDYYNENVEGSYVVMENDSPGEWQEFCSECRYDSKKAEQECSLCGYDLEVSYRCSNSECLSHDSFSAETEGGNQVFNSCWKCGSGQHLYQISRYPASPEEIAGVGADPGEAPDNWESGRPVQS